MKPRRVVVTGLGALTPIGNNISSFWEGLISGRSNGAAQSPILMYQSLDSILLVN